MKYLYITSSELAKLTGHNQYETVPNIVKALLKKFGIKDCYIPKSNTEEGLTKLTKDELTLLKEELSAVTDNTLYSSSIHYIESFIKKYIIIPTQKVDLDENQSRDLFNSLTMNGGVLEILSIYNADISFPLINDNDKSKNLLTPKMSFRFNPSDMKDYSSSNRVINANNAFAIK